MAEDRVQIKIGGSGVATVTMVRADKHNALDQAMFEGLMNAAGQLTGDPSVRAVVLHGEGKSFCSGLDIASFMSGQGGTGVLLERDGDRLANFAQRVTYDWSLVPAPVIAAIRELLRWWSADRVGRRHQDRCPGRETVDHGDQVGPRS
jgi:enoyl-CoA hydratase/carnithine racemase